MRFVFDPNPRFAQRLLNHALKKLYLGELGKRAGRPKVRRRLPGNHKALHAANRMDTPEA